MGYPKAFEDNQRNGSQWETVRAIEKVNESFRTWNQLVPDQETTSLTEVWLATQELRSLKTDLQGLLCKAENYVKLFHDPKFHLLFQLEQTKIENNRLRADGNLVSEVKKENQQLKLRLENLKHTLADECHETSQWEEMARKTLTEKDDKEREVQQLKDEVERLQAATMTAEAEATHLRGHNEKLKRELAEARQAAVKAVQKKGTQSERRSR